MRYAILSLALSLTVPECAAAAPLCTPLAHMGATYTLCRIDPHRETLKLFWGNGSGTAFGSLDALASDRKAKGEQLVIGMNAGMYDPDLKPVGLYVENGREIKALSTADGPGNFHLKPNGVFFIANGVAGVSETQAFAKSRIKPDFATQSGPMLLIDGRVHPRFDGYGRSMKIRNGVGIGPGGTVILAISREAVTFPQFAAFFRDVLKCRNALYLDGSISALRVEGEGGPPNLDQGGFHSLGPMIGVTTPDH